MCNNGSPITWAKQQAYINLRECLSHLSMPVHLLIGNHDRRDRLLEMFPNLPIDGSGFIQTNVEIRNF